MVDSDRRWGCRSAAHSGRYQLLELRWPDAGHDDDHWHDNIPELLSGTDRQEREPNWRKLVHTASQGHTGAQLLPRPNVVDTEVAGGSAARIGQSSG